MSSWGNILLGGLGGIFGGAVGGLFDKGSSSSAAAPIQNSDYNAKELDPILQNLMDATNRQGAVNWQGIKSGLDQTYQRRGLGGSGIEYANESAAGRQNAADTLAQNQSQALNLYNAWLRRRQQDIQQQQYAQQLANQQSMMNQEKRSSMWQGLGQLAGDWMNSD
jgi:uncharacterized membrane protein